MDENPHQLRLTAERAARAGAAVLGRHFGSRSLEVELKAENDLVTAADRESEAVIVDLLREAHPSHSILAEEGGGLGGLQGSSDYQWVIDPLDGTSNFVHGLPFFCVSIACRRGEELVAAAVCDPARGDMFAAAAGEGATRNGTPIRARADAAFEEAFLATGFPFRANQALEPYLAMFRAAFLGARGIRRCGAAALDLAYVAAGVYHGFFELGLAPWDVAAGALLVREAGGRVSDLDGGDSFLEYGNVLAGGPSIHGELLERFAAILGEQEARDLVAGPAVAAKEAEGVERSL